VIKRRGAFHARRQERFAQFSRIACKSHGFGQSEPCMLIEVDDEYLVVAMAGINESERSCDHIATLVVHTAAVVNDQADRCRAVLGLKYFYFLFPSVFVDAEIVPG